ncbi:D-alanyl-D-alanine carboxypeptidase/D-alanyl-D-alanine-endopeptidase [Oceaniglobus ichthyenteri]|uniref:D-alanyl-D-alanine carboxypeptidase/D-alanyl-D-alanine endopeptidase n=1 Tax=Oceaniglobus ichthyenteri TaxID=2136177 RepID=UPI000D3C6C0C|nr:D-alanyl-D-alanine carboxypeptidase/D-alanyl-D-alanine-endopeptidase [Oceaniglobus ichthyenteri]
MRLTRRTVLGGLFASAATPLVAEAPTTSIRPHPRASDFFKQAVKSAQDLVDEARLTGSVSFAVTDLRTGKILESRSAHVPQPPASTAKALTALYAMDALGADHRFETRLVATGPVENGRIEGDLILVGGGDPTLDTDGLADMAAQLKRVGVREVAGRFRVWDQALPRLPEIDTEQPDHVGYNPAIGGLNLNFNRVHFEWRREGGAYKVTMDARSSKYRPDVAVSRMQVIDRAVPIYTYAKGDLRDEWTVSRRALGTGGARWLPVRHPALYAGEVFMTLARANGIQLGHDAHRATEARGETLVTHSSVPLADVVQDMLKYSTNMTAEIIGLSASAKRGATLSDLPKSAAMMNHWLAQSAGAAGAGLIDHSGLGGDSRISAADMARVMVHAASDGRLRGLMKTYPIEDRPDVLVQAKTGTLNFVSALTGYVRAPGDVDLGFAIFCADPPRRAALSEAERERPEGGIAWARRARTLQWALLDRWSTIYAA